MSFLRVRTGLSAVMVIQAVACRQEGPLGEAACDDSPMWASAVWAGLLLCHVPFSWAAFNL